MSARRAVIGSRWGSLVGGPVRLGGRHYRLTVFPPGTDDRERWLLRVAQWWPAGGALASIPVFAVLDDAADVPLALVMAAAFFLGPYLALRRTLRRQRRDLCVVHAEYLYGPGTPDELARCQRLVALGSTLIDAEKAFDRGEIEPVAFQRIWGDVHAEARVLGMVRRAA